MLAGRGIVAQLGEIAVVACLGRVFQGFGGCREQTVDLGEVGILYPFDAEIRGERVVFVFVVGIPYEVEVGLSMSSRFSMESSLESRLSESVVEGVPVAELVESLTNACPGSVT